MGRPTELTEDIIEKAEVYLESYSENNEAIPTIAGLSKHCGLSRSIMYKWVAVEFPNEIQSQFLDIFHDVQQEQEIRLLSGGLSGDYNATITKLMLTKHGYSDKQETELSGPGGSPIEVDNSITVEFVNAD